MSNTDIPDPVNIPKEIAPVNPSELIIPAKEALHNAAISQLDVKKDYRSRVEHQEMVRAKYLAKIREEKEALKKDERAIKFKIENLKDHHDACLEALHYAKQDYDALVAKADLSGKASEVRAVMEGIEKEIADARREISELEALL